MSQRTVIEYHWRCDVCGAAITRTVNGVPAQWSGVWSKARQAYDDLCPTCTAARRAPAAGGVVRG